MSRTHRCLGLIDVLVVVAELPGELVYDLLEDDRVDVLSEHVEEEPVAHLGLLDDDVDAFLLHQPEPDVQEVGLEHVTIYGSTSLVKYRARSPRFIWASCPQLYSLAETPHPLSPPSHLGSYTRALLVSLDRRHLFVTPGAIGQPRYMTYLCYLWRYWSAKIDDISL